MGNNKKTTPSEKLGRIKLQTKLNFEKRWKKHITQHPNDKLGAAAIQVKRSRLK